MAITESVGGLWFTAVALVLAGDFVAPWSGLALQFLRRCGPLACIERSQKW